MGPKVRPPLQTPGFTLVEALIAAFIGALVILVAAEVSKRVVGVNAQGRSANQTTARGRILVSQLSSDLRLTGLASTGAVAVDGTELPVSTLASPTVGGRSAIPAIAGANNLPATPLGSLTLLEGSDAVQLIVSNPATSSPVSGYAAPGTQTIELVDGGALSECPFVLITDLGRATGAGRSQISGNAGVAGNTLTLNGRLVFGLQPESTVACARISTYWVDTDRWLHRTDVASGGLAGTVVSAFTTLGGGAVFVDTEAIDANDRVTPGVLDLQIAYRLSAEAFRLNGQAVPASADQAWAFDGSGVADGLLANPQTWFEVRVVRAVLTVQSLQTGHVSEHTRDIPRVLDGPGTLTTRFSAQPHGLDVAETLTNLEYYDLAAPIGQAPEPY
ncbi:MAG: hypothetical protein IPK13_06465 [Deltaproteobacteria bacterium]|nr:hypothetical protein [Deltaproteobacteria bacterium]